MNSSKEKKKGCVCHLRGALGSGPVMIMKMHMREDLCDLLPSVFVVHSQQLALKCFSRFLTPQINSEASQE